MTNSKLNYVVLPAKYSGAQFRSEYEAIFTFWYNRWSAAYAEIDATKVMRGDDFFRQAEVSAIFSDGKPVAAVLFDWFNLGDPAHLIHSYFESFSAANRVTAAAQLGQCLAFNNLAVDPAYRRQGVSMVDLAIGLAVKRFEASSFPNAICFCRNTRKINELLYRMGGSTLFADLKINGEESDFGVFDRHSIEKARLSPFDPLISELWDGRTMVSAPFELFELNKKGEK
jgi:hypothetical protein